MNKSALKLKKPDETPYSYIERVYNWCGWQYSNLLDDLPSLEALFDLHHLITVTCDADLIDVLFQGDPVSKKQADAWNTFVAKYNLKDWKTAKPSN